MAGRGGVQAPPRGGPGWTPSPHRSSVCIVTPISFATAPTLALSGGSNLATALFLNASPYLAIVLPYRPQVSDHIGATTILTRGGSHYGETGQRSPTMGELEALQEACS